MEMSLTRLQPSHNPVKKLKSIPLPDKPCEIFAILARIFILFCLVSSISLIFYTTFFPQTHSLHFPAPKRTAPEPKPEHEFGPTNISHILFGIGGSAATWNDRSRYSSLWWDAKKTRGFVWLDEIPGDKNNSFRISAPPYRLSSPEWTRFKFSSSRSAVRIARIISDSFKLNLPDVRWFVMGDDDTVYFTDNLVSVLAKYDHHQMWYIGGNSESVEQDVMHTYGMAFGGGGFAISYPLAEKLVKILDGCLDRYYYFYGSDQRIWACISEIGVPLTREQGFHQFDIRGSAYGLLAAHPIAPLVSLHHLDYVDSLFPYKNQMDSLKSLNRAYQLDPPRILQQTFCHDKNRKWSVSIAWGFTVQLYPLLLPAKDLQTPLLTFKTWRSWSAGPFTFNTQPMKSNPCELPVVFMLEQAEEVGQSGSLTRYKRLEPWPGKKCNRTDYAEAMSLQRIVVSALKLDPEFWTKNHERRRQCCDLRGIKKSNMQIRIRKCRPWETTTTER
ncbi:hypothetical protein P3X46_025585 [Hevea brasiliensis]|uniref:Uncharacterized protein n=1 Tax=Hevea brasiliensis TaxID=3981 RepID=A0ABQ9L654_HEVBR|nr:uncharacterized protein LOC110634968 [Hevea brasiliensis]KAJ9160155.1 hypothetical protein P3X46_025585 [Hevea brasiliensis]